MKVSYGRVMAVTLLLAGSLAGCTGGARKADLQEQLEVINKEMGDFAGLPKIKEDLAACREADRKAREDAGTEIERLMKENAELRTQVTPKS